MSLLRRTTANRRVVLTLGLIGLVFIAALFIGYRWRFPYGLSHQCILQFSGSLSAYAEDHGGAFPSGEATPEASLSLLGRERYITPALLSGKTVAGKVAERILSTNGFLGPETSGWHYVENLTTNDDPRLAIIWDKVAGLGHDGNRLRNGAREVLFVGGERRFIAGADWDVFLDGQEDLLKMREVVPHRGKPIMWAEVSFMDRPWLSSFDGKFKLYAKELADYREDQYVYSTAGTLSEQDGYKIVRHGQRLLPSDLTWFADEAPEQGAFEYTLTLSQWRSWPVVVDFDGGKPRGLQLLFSMSNLPYDHPE